MKTNRRQFLTTAGLSLGSSGLLTRTGSAAENARPSSFIVRAPKMKLGIVTHNIAKDWDVPTIIKNCAATKFQGVELRTTHAHGVEVALTPLQREEVKRRFRDSPVELMGLGSAFDFHTPDQTKLRVDIAAAKDYINLAQAVGSPGVKVRPTDYPRKCRRKRRWNRSDGHSGSWVSLARIAECKSGWKYMARKVPCCPTSRPSWTWRITETSAFAGTQIQPILTEKGSSIISIS